MTKPHVGVPALLREARAGLEQRPSRTVLTALGSVIGVMSLVVVLGLTESAGAQIGKRFDLVQETSVTALAVDQRLRVPPAPFPQDAETRVNAIDGVVSSGVSWKLTGLTATTRAWESQDAAASVEVFAATPGLFAADGAVFASGSPYNSAASDLGARVAVLGSGAAAELGVDVTTKSPTVFINGVPFTIVGVISDVDRQASLLRAVVIPTTAAVKLWGQPSYEGEPTLSVRVRTGAAAVVGSQIAKALDPTHPELYTVQTPPDPRGLRDGVQREMQWLFLGLAAVCLVVGMVGIANTTYVSVVERRAEIGVRRAMGARPRDILAQFLIESAGLGLVGGIVGTSVGLIGVVGTCLVLSWTAVVPTGVVIAGPVIGVLAGSLAGFYPAFRASRVEPMSVLRS